MGESYQGFQNGANEAGGNGTNNNDGVGAPIIGET